MKRQEIKSYFDNHPGVDELHFTSDNFAFFSQNDAENNARGLKDQKVTTITREEVDGLSEEDDIIFSSTSEDVVTEDFTTQSLKEEKITHTITQDDLDANPDLALQGVTVGEEVEITVKAVKKVPENNQEGDNVNGDPNAANANNGDNAAASNTPDPAASVTPAPVVPAAPTTPALAAPAKTTSNKTTKKVAGK